MKPEYLKVPEAKVPVGRLWRVSAVLLFAEGIFLLLFWRVHGNAIEPEVPGVYSLFGITSHPPHNVFFLPQYSGTVILLFAGFNSFIILLFYRHGKTWSWYLLLLVYLAVLIPPTIGAAISPGIGVGYYHEAGGGRPPWYNEVSLLGVIIPWVLFIPGILLGIPHIIGNRRRLE